MSAEIVLSNVSLTFGTQQVLAPLDLRIEPGEFVSLVGPSGCGKTSLLRLVAGLTLPSSGEVRMKLACESPYPGAKARLAYVFQEPRLLAWRDVLENIALPLELEGRPYAEARRAAHDAMKRVGLEEQDRHKLPSALSGGMRMRVSVARAIVTSPDALLLDEPFAALDDLSRQRLNEHLLQLWQQDRWTALFVTHHVAEAVYLSQRVFVIHGKPGKIIEEVRIPFDFPRSWALRATADFAALCGHITGRIRQEKVDDA